MISQFHDANQENRTLEGTELEDTMLTIQDRISQHAKPIELIRSNYDILLRMIGDARFVLIGEATHGTHEFYQTRAEITRRLIEEKGFVAVAVEADWPDAYRVNRYVHGRGEAASPNDALADFKRFPSWMWRNTVVEEFVDWLRQYNASDANRLPVGFYGLDLYSLHASMEAVVNYLEKVDPEAAQRARFRYSCFEDFGEDPQIYGYAASIDMSPTCQREVLEQLQELRRQAFDYTRRDGFVAQDEFFFAEQNALIARNAEAYYRSMFDERPASWNLRDRHMMETLAALERHLAQSHHEVKIVVWAHNSHLGDARATEMNLLGELNLGQLARQRYGPEVFSLGFTTYHGTVTAASDWGGPAQLMSVRPALASSIERLLHSVDVRDYLLPLRGMDSELSDLNRERLQRAIGVIYRPDTERISHYFGARLKDQFDAVIHFDRTRALRPLELTSEWEMGEIPETYPSGV
jgi:erythromycin esterase-like protein